MFGNIFHILGWYPTEYNRSHLVAEKSGVIINDFESQFLKVAAQNCLSIGALDLNYKSKLFIRNDFRYITRN